MFLPIKEQMKVLLKGVVDCVSEVELRKKLEKSFSTGVPLKVKLGADPTRPDLHLGHTVVLNKLRDFQKLGHHVQFLIGDFTAQIGDPTGKNETRPQLTSEDVKDYSITYAQQVFKILDPEKTEVLYNSTWFNEFKPSDFIKLTSHYTVARMLERDDFEKRYKKGESISIHEFLYPLIQGYDSFAMKSDIELGGTDQRFNLLVGRDIQKSYGMQPQCIMMLPLLIGLDGVQKMSKSCENYIGVNESATDIFGKTMRLSDDLMFDYYELLTDKTSDEITHLKKDVQLGEKHPRDLKVQLARYFVSQFYNEQKAHQAEQEFNRIFVSKGLPDQIPEKSVHAHSIWVCRFLVDLGLADSTSDARRLIKGRAVEKNGEKILNENIELNLESGKEYIFKVGKKKFLKLFVH